MKERYRDALIVGSLGVLAITWSVLVPGGVPFLGLLIGAGALPVSILLAVAGRMDLPIPGRSVAGGATVGPIVAILSHTFVFGFAYLFFFGFADAATSALEALRIDPTFIEVAGSPWVVLAFIELAMVAPFTEEIGKAIGASYGQPTTRSEAFMAGVAAGVGFAVIENLLYTSGGFFFGPSWEAIASARMLGAAVHPLASGLVVLGWWEWRHGRDLGLLARRFLSGAGVHALWNGSLVVMVVVGQAYGVEELLGFGVLGIAYSAVLGVLAVVILWKIGATLAADEGTREFVFDGSDITSIAGWVVVASSLLIPMALLFLSFPNLGAG